MSHEHIPSQVKGAIANSDHAALSAMGKKGAEHSNLKREHKREVAEEDRAKYFAERAKVEVENDDGDVVVPENLTDDAQEGDPE